MDVKIYPGKLSGTITAPPSKSIAHRALICAMLSGEKCNISNLELTEDVLATQNAVLSISERKEELIDCKESASTLRFMLFIAAALGRKASFTGGPRLATRPLEPLLTLLKDHGVIWTSGGSAGWFPLSIDGKLRGEKYAIRGDMSAQFISGLLMALPLIGRDCEIVLTTPLISKDYIALTIDIMEKFGVKVRFTGLGWEVPGRQAYIPTDLTIEGDYSLASYFLCANQFPKGNVEVRGLSPSSKQADMAVPDILLALGEGLEIDGKDIPDSIPALAVMAAFAPGKTTFFNAGRLRMCQNDRLSVIRDAICKMGGQAEITDDRITVIGGKRLAGGVTVCANGDYRIAMALVIGALGCEKPVTIIGAESINKAYPNFFRDLKTLGGVAELSQH